MECMRNGFEHGKLLGGRFLTVSPLNHGSFGMVFTAKDTLTGQDVAIKCITKPGATSENMVCPTAIAIDELSEELAIHSSLPPHPNIVNFVGDFETENHSYMVLELCTNGDLYEAIRVGRGPLETEHVRALMLELVDAIDHMHSNGVYHRDIKPENIFLTSNGSMKLGDFGLATTDTWSTEFAVGSDRYMAPEQFDSSVYGYGYSPAAADVWALGIVLLNVLFQRNPFATPTQKDPLFADFVHDRQSLFDVFPNLSQDAFNVLMHSLALDPANRSLGAVREAIKDVVSFTTDEECLDDFCTEQTDLVPGATAARQPLRTPSITSPNMSSTDSFPWPTALLTTPPKATRQLSTIHDEEMDMYPESIKAESQYHDADQASLASNLDSGLGMSYKSSKSSVSKPLASIIGSLPISFSRPSIKSSPYGAKGSGFSKSWSDLYDEDVEMSDDANHMSFDEQELEHVTATKHRTPLNAIKEEDGRGSVTPRPLPAQLVQPDASRTASPLMQLVEHDKVNDVQSPKQRSASILDKWAALGTLRRTKPDTAVMTSNVTATPTPQRTRNIADAFSSLSPFGSSSKPKPQPRNKSKSRDRAGSWRQGSPQRLRATTINNSRVWERKEKDRSPTSSGPKEAWSLDSNWREHKSVVFPRYSPPPLPPGRGQSFKPEKTFLDEELEANVGEMEQLPSPRLSDDMDAGWVGGFNDFH
nr:serine/threonine-protein kinase ksp1 [Quercus suber]